MGMSQRTQSPPRAARLRRGWTLRELARRCADKGVPVDHGQLARIERQEAIPRPRLRAVLADLLDLDAVTDFKRASREPADTQTADVDMRRVRDGERAVQSAVPDLQDAPPAEREVS